MANVTNKSQRRIALVDGMSLSPSQGVPVTDTQLAAIKERHAAAIERGTLVITSDKAQAPEKRPLPAKVKED